VTAHADRPGRERSRGFATVAAVLFLLLFAASAPTPLYALYAVRWNFSATTLTAVFAVYALALLVTLLVAGSVSDAVGRRPVILLGLALLLVAEALFLAADGVGWLFAARIVQGVATGLVTSGVAAALIDLQPAGRPGTGSLLNAVVPTAGLAVGALVCGALVQYATAPFRLSYWLLLAATLLASVALVRLVPETSPHTGRLDLRPRIGVDPAARALFRTVAPCLVATWALGGLYLSLGPSLAGVIAGSTNRLLGGAFVFALCAPGAVTSYLVRARSGAQAMAAGCVLLVAGSGVTIVAVAATSTALLFAATAVAGCGFGSAFFGAFRQLVSVASPLRRGELVAAIYVVAYLAFSVPAVVAGLVSTHVGLRQTAIDYAAVVLALAATSLALSRRPSAQAAPDPALS